jgi:hypothetical protein
MLQLLSDDLSNEPLLMRRAATVPILHRAWAAGQRICVLSCGYFREADDLIGFDLSNISVVEQCHAAIRRIAKFHGYQIVIEKKSYRKFLEDSAALHERYDLIYSLELADHLDNDALKQYLILIRSCLNSGGVTMFWNFANIPADEQFVETKSCTHYFYRSKKQLQLLIESAGLRPIVLLDPSGRNTQCYAALVSDRL